MATVIDRAMKLFDPPTFEPDKIAASWRKGEALLEGLVARELENVEALYTLAWAYDANPKPPEGAMERIGRLCEQLRELTRRVPIKKSDEPNVAARARAFALSWDVPERAQRAESVADAEQLVRAAADAHTLRATLWTVRAVLGAKAGLVFAKARASKKLETAYEWLLAWVEKNPVHSSYAPEEGKKIALCCGLEPFFDDVDFVAWLDARRAKKSVARNVDARAMAFAAGADKIAFAYNGYERPRFGRLGRMLALRALGVPFAATVKRDLDDGKWSTVEIVAQVSPAILPELAARGLSLDRGVGKTPPIVSLTDWGAYDAVAALVAAGANRDAEDGQGRTAVDVARKKKAAEGIKALGATRSSDGADLAPLRAAIDAVEKDVVATRWAKHADLGDLGALRKLCDDLEAVARARSKTPPSSSTAWTPRRASRWPSRSRARFALARRSARGSSSRTSHASCSAISKSPASSRSRASGS